MSSVYSMLRGICNVCINLCQFNIGVIYLQDSLYKKHAGKDVNTVLLSCIKMLMKGHLTLREFKSNPNISMGYIEAIAGTKFVIMEVAKYIFSQFSRERAIVQVAERSELFISLMEQVKKVCTDTVINTTTLYGRGNLDVTGPVVYLLKLLVRQFSLPCLKQASERYPWIIPEGLRTSNLVSRSSFVK